MKKYMYSLAILLLFGALHQVLAGNLSNFKLKIPIDEYIKYNDQTNIEVEGQNKNTTYSVTGIKVDYRITDTKLNSIVYTYEKSIPDVKPLEKFTVNLGVLPWDKLEVGGSYKLSMLFSADYDEDMSDNELLDEFGVISNLLAREEALAIFEEFLDELFGAEPPISLQGYLSEKTYLKGTEYSLDLYNQNIQKLGKDFWIGYVDEDVDSYLMHKSKLYFIDAVTGMIEPSETLYFRPRFNGEFHRDGLAWDEGKILGRNILYEQFNEDDLIFDISNPQQEVDSVGCFLITGVGTNDRERYGFRAGSNLMRREFTLEKTSPKVSVDQIKEFHNNPEGLINEIENITGNYKKMYLYYNGHADTNGQMIFGNGLISYIDIIKMLKDKGVQEICLVIDACYSGKVIEQFKEDSELAEFNVTILASSDKDLESKLRSVDIQKDGQTMQVAIGAFTNSLCTSLGSGEADRNKDGKTTFIEAFENVLERNPLISNDQTTRISDQKPQIFTQENRSTSSEKISFENSDLKVGINSGLMNNSLKVTLYRGEMVYSNPNHPDIFKASTSRLWELSLKNNSGEKFDVDLEFAINQFWDDFGVGEGIPGIIYRETANDSWKPYYLTEFNTSAKTITAYNVSSFSQWSLARVAEVNSVRNLNNIDQDFQVYPNPVEEMINIRSFTNSISNVRIELYNSIGDKILEKELSLKTDIDGKIDLLNLTTGAYQLLIFSGNDIFQKNFIKY